MSNTGITPKPAQSASQPSPSSLTRHRNLSAMPGSQNGIRVRFEDDEPPDVAFHEQALPGALVSWAWCQLVALNELLDAITAAQQGSLGGPDTAGAVQSTLVPVINALRFSERRAHELRCSALTAGARQGEKPSAQRPTRKTTPSHKLGLDQSGCPIDKGSPCQKHYRAASAAMCPAREATKDRRPVIGDNSR
jgi:hypothetical protein